MDPKARQVCSKFAFSGTSWRQVGQPSAIWAPTWPILAPRCAPTGIQMEPQMPPNSHLGHLGAKGVTRELNSGPGAPTNLKKKQSWTDSELFSKQLFDFQPQARHAGGLARAAHWIYPPAPAKGRRHGVLDLASNPFSPSRSLNSSSRHPRRAPGCPRQLHRSSPLATLFRSKFAFLVHPRQLRPNILQTRSHLDAKIAQESPTSRQDAPR